MKILIFILLGLLVFGCKNPSSRKTDSSIGRRNEKSIISKLSLDTLKIEKVLKGKKNKMKYPIQYDAIESDTAWSYIYTVKELNLQFINTFNDNFTFRILKLNKKEVEKIPLSDFSDTKIVSMDMSIDYTESDFYKFKTEQSYILIVSKPTNWVGIMTKYSFYQLLNLKEKSVIEFIRE